MACHIEPAAAHKPAAWRTACAWAAPRRIAIPRVIDVGAPPIVLARVAVVQSRWPRSPPSHTALADPAGQPASVGVVWMRVIVLSATAKTCRSRHGARAVEFSRLGSTDAEDDVHRGRA
jgi:hypothetical protein